MKLLLDENLSFRLQGLLADIYPDALLRNQYIMVRNFAEDETAAFLPLFSSKII
jgi:predicted nuclease of predicted toxin-antitoxin system